MIENCAITNLDVHGGVFVVTSDKYGDQQFTWVDDLRTYKPGHERCQWPKPDCRWLPEPVEVMR